MCFGRLILTGNLSTRDSQTVPRINRGDREGEIGDLLLVEMCARLFVRCIGRVSLCNQRERFSPGQCRAFAVRVVRAFTPRIERVEALFAFSNSAEILPVHVEAEGTAVDL